MSTERAALLLSPFLALATPVSAQEPMSAIEWLDDVESLAALESGTSRESTNEPPITEGAGLPEVEVRPLDQIGDGPIGLMPTAVTGLPADLWLGSDPARVGSLLEDVVFEDLPAMQSLLYSLLLTETTPPAREGDRPGLLFARIDKLVEMGAVEPALALIEHAGPATHPGIFHRYFDLSLLAGTEGEACARMADRPDLAPSAAARVYCLARMGDWQAAMVTYTTLSALGEFSPRAETLLTLFLEPELIEDMPPLAPSAEITPLVFRLEEAIGQPLPTATLPRAYAIADLRDVSGWKAELEAVERLARTGALSENRLIGVYTARQPAASGGIWDRVAAVQAFDAAMSAASAREVARTLPDAWRAMRDARLEVPFARLYGAALIDIDLPEGAAQRAALEVALLSPAYETAATTMPATGSEATFLAALAGGDVGDVKVPPSTDAHAVAEAFSAPPVASDEARRLIAEDRLGEAILSAMQLYGHAAQGEAKDATRALATFRALGLEDTARRAALQMLILDRRG